MLLVYGCCFAGLFSINVNRKGLVVVLEYLMTIPVFFLNNLLIKVALSFPIN